MADPALESRVMRSFGDFASSVGQPAPHISWAKPEAAFHLRDAGTPSLSFPEESKDRRMSDNLAGTAQTPSANPNIAWWRTRRNGRPTAIRANPDGSPATEANEEFADAVHDATGKWPSWSGAVAQQLCGDHFSVPATLSTSCDIDRTCTGPCIGVQRSKACSNSDRRANVIVNPSCPSDWEELIRGSRSAGL
jgi:hypothetical protein